MVIRVRVDPDEGPDRPVERRPMAAPGARACSCGTSTEQVCPTCLRPMCGECLARHHGPGRCSRRQG